MPQVQSGSATDRKIVVISLMAGMSVVQMLPDGSSKREQEELASPAEARRPVNAWLRS